MAPMDERARLASEDSFRIHTMRHDYRQDSPEVNLSVFFFHGPKECAWTVVNINSRRFWHTLLRCRDVAESYYPPFHSYEFPASLAPPTGSHLSTVPRLRDPYGAACRFKMRANISQLYGTPRGHPRVRRGCPSSSWRVQSSA